MNRVAEADLHAYVDGVLAEGRRAEVEAQLDANPDDAAKVADYAAQLRALRQLFDGVLDEPVPESLLRRSGARPTAGATGWRIAAALGWLALGAALGWTLKPAPPNAQLAAGMPKEAAVAHAVYAREVRHPVEVAAAEEQHLVSWLSKRLGGSVRAPKLDGLGYGLVGGRLLPSGQGAAAQFMYENAHGDRLTLYVRKRSKAQEDTAFRFAQEGKVAVFYWIERDFGYALSGETDRERLRALARAVYEQLTP